VEQLQYISQALIDGILKSGLYGLAAVGMALVLGVVKILNFAHGDFSMLATYFAVFLFLSMGVDPLLALPITIILFFGLGAVTYKGLIKPILKSPELNQLLLTFGLSIVLQNVVMLVTGGDPKMITVPYKNMSISFFGIYIGVGRLIAFLIAGAMIAFLYFFIMKTNFGKSIRAVSQNVEGASLVGIEAGWINLSAFSLSIVMASIAGVMLSLILSADPLLGGDLTLKSIAIVVVAGMGNIFGVIWASLLLGIVESFVSTFVPNGSPWAEGAFFVLIFMTILFRHQEDGSR
jgi:branched-chain amino acid transport system permease protein